MSSDYDRYVVGAEAVQSAIVLSHMPEAPLETQQVAFGVTSARVEIRALVALLIKAGTITQGDWIKALADEMEEEAKKYGLLIVGRGDDSQ